MENMETSTEGVFHEARVSKSELMRTGLSIDLNLPMPVVVNGWDCQHFSIRGNPSEQLPPIGVPEHKRWWCANCIHNIGADESAVEKIVDASVNTRSTNFVFKAGVRVEETGLATDVILSKQCSTREIKTNCPVANQLKNSTNTKPIPSNDGNDKVVPHERRCSDGRDSEIDLEKGKGVQNGQRTASNTSDQINVLGSKENIDNMSNMNLHRLTSLESRKVTYQTPKGGEVNLAENHQCKNTTNDLKRWRTPKVCLMVDLLQRSCDNAEVFSTNTIPIEPSKPDTVSPPKDNGINISHKKRNMSQKDACRSGINLDQTLSSFKGFKKYVENAIIQCKGIINSPLILQNKNRSFNSLKSNVVESSYSLIKGVNPIGRQSIVAELGHFSRKEVNPLLGESILAKPRQSSRTRVIDLNHRKEIQSAPNLLQRGNLQIKKPMEMPHPCSRKNSNKVQSHSYVNNPQRNQQPLMGIHPQIQHGVFTWLNPGSTNFHPMYTNVNANIGVVRGNTPNFFNIMANTTAMAQVQEQQFKLFGAPSNVVQVSAPIPTQLGLQHSEGSNHVWLPIEQNIAFRCDNQQNYRNQKGRTISDIKSVDLNKVAKVHMNSKCMPATQLLRHQERPFPPCNIHPPFRMGGNPEQVVSLRQEKKRKAHAPIQLGGRKFQQFAFSSGLLRSTRDPGPSSSRVSLLQDDNFPKSLGVGGLSTAAAIFPISSIP